jgi:hypothetical protein
MIKAVSQNLTSFTVSASSIITSAIPLTIVGAMNSSATPLPGYRLSLIMSTQSLLGSFAPFGEVRVSDSVIGCSFVLSSVGSTGSCWLVSLREIELFPDGRASSWSLMDDDGVDTTFGGRPRL